MLQPPAVRGDLTGPQRQVEGTLPVRAGREPDGFEHGVAEADVRDPDAVGRVVRGQAVHGEPEMVGDPAGRLGIGQPLDDGDVPPDVVPERRQQGSEGAVVVEAVAGPAGADDPVRRLQRVDSRRAAEVDVQGGVGDAQHVGAVQHGELLDAGAAGHVHLEASEVAAHVDVLHGWLT